MIKIVGMLFNRKVLFLGLERTNTDRMHDDQPIVVDLQAVIAGLDDQEPIQDLIIFADETLEGAYNQLKKRVPHLPAYEDVKSE